MSVHSLIENEKSCSYCGSYSGATVGLWWGYGGASCRRHSLSFNFHNWGDGGATVGRRWGDGGATVGRQWGDKNVSMLVFTIRTPHVHYIKPQVHYKTPRVSLFSV